VLDAEGSLIAEDVTSRTNPAVIQIPEEDGPLFVRLTWPSGKTQTQKVSLVNRDFDVVHFTDEQISRNEWSAWRYHV